MWIQYHKKECLGNRRLKEGRSKIRFECFFCDGSSYGVSDAPLTPYTISSDNISRSVEGDFLEYLLSILKLFHLHFP